MDFPKLVRLDTVLEMTTLSTATIYRLMKKGKFPRQIKSQKEELDGLLRKFMSGWMAILNQEKK